MEISARVAHLNCPKREHYILEEDGIEDTSNIWLL